MILKVKDKEYTLRIGSRALLAMSSKAEELAKGNLDFDALVDLAYAGIKEKGELTRDEVDEALDTDFSLMQEIMKEIAALKGLGEEAKKPTAK
jgi:hypothetical protein